MGAEQSGGAQPAPAAAVSVPQTVAHAESAFAEQRQARLDSAIDAALSGRLSVPTPPEGGVDPKAPKRRTAGLAPASTARSSGTNTSQRSGQNGASSRTASPGLASATSDQGLSATPSEEGSSDSGLAAVESGELGDDTGEAVEDGAQEGASEAEETEASVGYDQAELARLASRKDLRGIEKLLGLETGVLGATNGEFAALRRREDAVSAREAQVQQTHESNNQKLINKFGGIADLIQHANQGNLRAYAATIERTTALPIAVFIDLWNKNIGQIPQDQLAVHRRAARFSQPQEPQQDPSAGQQQTQADPAAARSAALAKANEHVATAAKGHPALALQGGADAVRDVWLKSHDKASNSFRLTVKQAADQVVQQRKQAIEREQWILSGKQPPQRPRTRAVNRNQAAETQQRPAGPIDRDAAIEQHARIIRNAKNLEARQSRR